MEAETETGVEERSYQEAHARLYSYAYISAHIGGAWDACNPYWAGVVCDVPCGSGYGAKHFTEHRESWHGLDKSEEAIAFAKEHHGKENTHFRVGDMLELPWEDNFADTALCIEGIEHVEHDVTAMRELARILKPGGVLALSTPDIMTRFNINCPHHVREYSQGEIAELINRAELEIVGWHRLGEGYIKHGKTMLIMATKP